MGLWQTTNKGKYLHEAANELEWEYHSTVKPKYRTKDHKKIPDLLRLLYY